MKRGSAADVLETTKKPFGQGGNPVGKYADESSVYRVKNKAERLLRQLETTGCLDPPLPRSCRLNAERNSASPVGSPRVAPTDHRLRPHASDTTRLIVESRNQSIWSACHIGAEGCLRVSRAS